MYSRTRCGLCDEARGVIFAVRGATDFEFEEIFIDGNEELEEAYGLQVPVVFVDGEQLFDTQVDPTLFQDALSRVAGEGD